MIGLRKLATVAAASMKSEGLKKHVTLPKTALYVSDDSGDTRTFYVRKASKDVPFTIEDIEKVFSAVLRVMYDAIQSGEKVQIKDFGSFEAKYRAPRSTRHPCTGEMVVVPGRYVVKFTPGNRMKISARLYEKKLDDIPEEQEPLFDESIYMPDEDDEEVMENGSRDND